MTFSAYMPTIKEVVVGTKYVLNGDNNKNYKLFGDAYDDSTTNSSCINDVVNYIVGEGLYNNGQEVTRFISDQDVRLLVLDYEKQGQCAVQIVFVQGKPTKLFYVPIEQTALNVDRYMKVNGYWYSYDWANRYKYTPTFHQVFGTENPEGLTQMLIIRRPTNEPLFSKPRWFPALRWAQIEGVMAQHAYGDSSTGFTGQKVINWSGGAGLDDSAKRKAREEIKSNFTGIDGKRTIISINDSPENSVIVDNIDPPNVNALYVNYTEEAERKIMIANSYPSILLAGSKTGFSSNADEIAVATKSLFRRVVRLSREVILAGLLPIFRAIDPNASLSFKDFADINLDSNDNGTGNTSN